MTNEPDQLDKAILIDYPSILTPASLAEAIDTVKKIFAEFNYPQPPASKAHWLYPSMCLAHNLQRGRKWRRYRTNSF